MIRRLWICRILVSYYDPVQPHSDEIVIPHAPKGRDLRRRERNDRILPKLRKLRHREQICRVTRTRRTSYASLAGPYHNSVGTAHLKPYSSAPYPRVDHPDPKLRGPRRCPS